MTQRDDLIRASEVSQHAFCARAWWFSRVKGYPSANVVAMRLGTARHRAHGRALERTHLLRRAAVMLLVLAAVLLIAWLLWNLGS
jgi:hypothetical protein